MESVQPDLKRDGYALLRGVYSRDEVVSARQQVLSHIHTFRNTRPTLHSGHLAGFHRFPELEQLHVLLSGNPDILDALAEEAPGSDIRTIGLSDITVNRSQQWHVDLLRGRFSKHINGVDCWGDSGGGVWKAIVYLQEGNSLQVIPGAHLRPVPLNSDSQVIPEQNTLVNSVSVEAGDVVLIDLRLPHRGSKEEDFDSPDCIDSPKILLSTVFADYARPLAQCIEIGNFERLIDWEARNGDKPIRQEIFAQSS